jgi:hypothetical protein
MTADTTTASGLGWPGAAVPELPAQPEALAAQGVRRGWVLPALSALLLVLALVAGALAVV